MKKFKFINIIIITTLICNLFFTTFIKGADYDSDVIISMQIDNPYMEVNGVTAEIDSGRGTAPIIRNGRTLVPIRAIIEAFDGNVTWNENTASVGLFMNGESITLTIDSYTAYLNDKAYTLDVAPTVINSRTMLPVRFVAEGFNIGVAWDEPTRTVSLVRNTFDKLEYENLITLIPPYNGNAYAVINQNKPFFKGYEIINGSFEYYSSHDNLGRCNTCMASIGTDLMPTDNRESISSVKPTGWQNKEYEHIDGGYIYNRCHLIGFQLTGENANNRNLITGTRYLNIEGMLPFENMVDDYIEETGNHVMYRATPVFTNDNLLADGVLLEAYSVEDDGAGISFCIYCYNVQPGVNIDYATGANSQGVIEPVIIRYYRTPTGKKYHIDAQCGGKTAFETTLEQALNDGLTPCLKCAS